MRVFAGLQADEFAEQSLWRPNAWLRAEISCGNVRFEADENAQISARMLDF
jgi:hypothetical protein